MKKKMKRNKKMIINMNMRIQKNKIINQVENPELKLIKAAILQLNNMLIVQVNKIVYQQLNNMQTDKKSILKINKL